jgi:hypothetical protein
MHELGKYFHIYRNETHKKWPELIKHIENWLNSSVSTVTGYAPIELLNGEARPVLFKRILKKQADNLPIEEDLPENFLKAYG